MIDDFYVKFEEKFRGSREMIKSRLRVYLPFVCPLLQAYPGGQAIDLGCGRGEWLELLKEHGFDPQGVDLDEGMLQACKDIGLNVQAADALVFLQSLPDESQLIVSGFHIVEHLPFDLLQQLVLESKRVLKSGGLLIFETPNPENVAVGTSSFYLDPTHQRPIPPELLSFLPEYYGFDRYKVLRLQEPPELAQSKHLSLLEVMTSVSPDYAVVAQKSGKPGLTEALEEVFQKEYGLNLHTLAERYQQQLSAAVEHAEAKAEHAEAKAEHAEAKAEHAEAKAEQAELASNQHVTQLQAVYASRSWRIIAPLRWLVQQLRLLRQYGHDARTIVKKIFRKASNYSKLKACLIAIPNRLGLTKRFRQDNQVFNHTAPLASYTHEPNALIDLAQMTPRARQIYSDLKAAIESSNKGGL